MTGWSSAAGSSCGPQPETTPLDCEPVESRLHGATGGTQAPGRLEHPDAGLGGEQFEQSADRADPSSRLQSVQCVQCVGRRCAHCLLIGILGA